MGTKKKSGESMMAVEQSVEQLIQGLTKKYGTASPAMKLGGVSMSYADVQKLLAADVQILEAVTSAQQALDDAIAARDAKLTQIKKDRDNVRLWVMADIGDPTSSELPSFGIAQKVPRAAVSKTANATRKLQSDLQKQEEAQLRATMKLVRQGAGTIAVDKATGKITFTPAAGTPTAVAPDPSQTSANGVAPLAATNGVTPPSSANGAAAPIGATH